MDRKRRREDESGGDAEAPEGHDEEGEVKLCRRAAHMLEIGLARVQKVQAHKEKELYALTKMARERWQSHRKLHKMPLHVLLRRYLLINELSPDESSVFDLVNATRQTKPMDMRDDMKLRNTPLAADFAREWESMYQAVYAYHQKQLAAREGLPHGVAEFQATMRACRFGQLFNNHYTSRMPPDFIDQFPLLRSVEPALEMPAMRDSIQRRREAYLRAWDAPEPPEQVLTRARAAGRGPIEPASAFALLVQNMHVASSQQVYHEAELIKWGTRMRGIQAKLRRQSREFLRVMQAQYPATSTVTAAAVHARFGEFLQANRRPILYKTHEQVVREQQTLLMNTLDAAPVEAKGDVKTTVENIHSFVGMFLATRVRVVLRGCRGPPVPISASFSTSASALRAQKAMEEITGAHVAHEITAAYPTWLRKCADENLEPLVTALHTTLTELEHNSAPGEYREKVQAGFSYLRGAVHTSYTETAIATFYPRLADFIKSWIELQAFHTLLHYWCVTLRGWLDTTATALPSSSDVLISLRAEIERANAAVGDASGMSYHIAQTSARFKLRISALYQERHVAALTAAASRILPRASQALNQMAVYTKRCADYMRGVLSDRALRPPPARLLIIRKMREEVISPFRSWTLLPEDEETCMTLSLQPLVVSLLAVYDPESEDVASEEEETGMHVHIAVLRAFLAGGVRTRPVPITYFLSVVFACMVLYQCESSRPFIDIFL